MEPRWTLDELSRRVEAVLAHAGPALGQHNGQVSEVPNARTIRYYTTIGLLDRPLPMGRTATYGRRHLEQIVAIKRLQAQGLPLAQVQERLAGLDADALAMLADLPGDSVVEGALQGPEPRRESRRERSFWGEAPAAPDVTHPPAPRPGLAEAGTGTGGRISGLHLDDVTLAFLAARDIDDDDLEALRAALLPVVETLRARGLIPAKKEGEQP